MKGIIESIKTYSAKGAPGRELAEAHFIEDIGLEGDFYAKGGERQLSLLVTESREDLNKEKEKGLCFSRFRENISISGLTPDSLRGGLRLEAGEVVLEITGEKGCHEECVLYKAGKACHLAGRSFFARVLLNGLIHTGDEITVK
jgi:cyclic pyranopterin phosphate synthase